MDEFDIGTGLSNKLEGKKRFVDAGASTKLQINSKLQIHSKLAYKILLIQPKPYIHILIR